MSGKSPKIMTPTIMKEVDNAKLEELANKENEMKEANKKQKKVSKKKAKQRKQETGTQVKLKYDEEKGEYKYKIKSKDGSKYRGTREQMNKEHKRLMKKIDKLTGDYVAPRVQFSECIQDSECEDPERPKCLQKTNEGGLGSCVSVKEFDKRQSPSKVNSGGRTRKRRKRRKRKTRKRKRKKSRKKRKKRRRRTRK